MSDFDDENLEFDEDLPELDLSDLDSLEEEEKSEKKYQLKKYEGDSEDSEEFAELIKAEAFKALDIQEKGEQLPEEYTFDENEQSDAEFFDYSEEDFDEEKKKKKGGLALKIVIGVLALVLCFVAFVAFTEPGRNLLYKIGGTWIENNVNKEIDKETEPDAAYPTPNDPDKRNTVATIIPLEEGATPTVVMETATPRSEFRSEDYVKTYLLFGIEEIAGANTDAMLLLSVNTKDNSIKLTSIMRDIYVDIPGYYPNKINSVYATGMKAGETVAEKKMAGGKLLTEVIEKTFDIEIEGFACVNFKNFENIINRLGGIDLELGSKEANYLCTTNYISNPSYRYVKAGWNHMNGNQVLGYCRVRKVATLGGASNDYGRTLRHRRVINAVVQQYKNLPLGDMYGVLKDCLAYVITDLTEEDFTSMLRDVFENKTFQLDQLRLPIDGKFKDSGKKGTFNGKYNVTYAIMLDNYLEDNIKALHEFVFLDGQEISASGEQTAGSGEPQLPTVTPTP